MNSRDLDRIFLVEQCEKINCSQLIRQIKQQIKKELLKARLEAEDMQTEILESRTGNGGCRLWFKSPQCKERKENLYRHPITEIIACKNCLDLRYKSQARRKI